MAVNKKLDDPKRNSVSGFLSEAFEETKKNNRARLNTDKIRNDGIRKFENGVMTAMFSTMLAVPLSLVFMNGEVQKYDAFADQIAQTTTDAVEDINVENGIIVEDGYIAIRNGDEFTLYGLVGTRSGDATFQLIDDADTAEQIAQDFIDQYQSYKTALEFEEENGINVEINDNAVFYDLGLISQPYSINDEAQTFVTSIGVSISDTDLDLDDLQDRVSDWETVFNSIADGGYADGIDELTTQGDLPDLGNNFVLNNMLLGYATFFGLSFAGGAAITAVRRNNERRRRFEDKDKKVAAPPLKNTDPYDNPVVRKPNQPQRPSFR